MAEDNPDSEESIGGYRLTNQYERDSEDKKLLNSFSIKPTEGVIPSLDQKLLFGRILETKSAIERLEYELPVPKHEALAKLSDIAKVGLTDSNAPADPAHAFAELDSFKDDIASQLHKKLSLIHISEPTRPY